MKFADEEGRMSDGGTAAVITAMSAGENLKMENEKKPIKEEEQIWIFLYGISLTITFIGVIFNRLPLITPMIISLIFITTIAVRTLVDKTNSKNANQ